MEPTPDPANKPADAEQNEIANTGAESSQNTPPPMETSVPETPPTSDVPSVAETPSSDSAPVVGKARPEARPPSPSELAASVTADASPDLDKAVEDAMMGLSGIDTAMDAGGTPPTDEPTVGNIVSGRIANIGSEDVLVDFGGKSLGSMALAEFEKDEKYAVGDAIQVMIVSEDERAGLLRVSRSKARRAAVIDNMKVGLEVDAHISGMNKGGLEVQVEGMRGFIPASQVDTSFMKDISDLIGQTVRAEVTKFEMDEPGHENIVLSRRKVLVREEAARKEQMFEELQVGDVRRGKVRNIADYGAFVDLGGFDGLLHISDMSWGRVKKADEVVKIGDEIEVKVIKLNKEKKKISLSLKQTTPNPWSQAQEKYDVGTKVNGRVVRLESFGAFVELEPGLDGLLPVSEMSWTRRVRHPSEVVKEGDVVEVSVINLDLEKQRLSLSLKALGDDPWGDAASKYAEGSKIKGKVVRTTDFGAFVELEEGIDGLIHISELSEERVRKVTDKVQPGQEVEVRVLGVDTNAKKISLSMKQPPREPTPQELAQIEAERAAMEKRRNKKRRGGITFDFDGGGLGGLDPSKFAQ